MASTAQEQQLIQGQAGTLVSYPPILAQPTSVVARVSGPTLTMPAVGVAGVVDTVATTTSTVAIRGATTIALASPIALVRGRQYLVVDSTTGARIVVESTETGTLSSLVMQSPLPVEVAAGAAVLGYAVLFAISAVDVGTNLGRGVASWEATIGGKIVAWAQDWRVVRRLVAFNLTGNDVEQMSPYATTMRPANDNDWTESLRTSWWLHVAPALAAKGIGSERIISWEVLNPWHLAALEYHLAVSTPDPDASIREEKKAALIEARDLALQSFRFWTDIADNLTPPAPTTAYLDLSTTFVTR